MHRNQLFSSDDYKDSMKKKIPIWVVGSIIGVVIVLALLVGIPMVTDPPPAASFNDRPLAERKAEVEAMRSGVEDRRVNRR